MNKMNKLSFHHIGKPIDLEEIKDHPETKYSPLFDMYSLDVKNSLSMPIELHAFGPIVVLIQSFKKKLMLLLQSITLN